MNQQLKEYTVKNVFCNLGENEHKKRVNKAIKNLCVFDVEKNIELYNNASITFHDSVSTFKKGGAL